MKSAYATKTGLVFLAPGRRMDLAWKDIEAKAAYMGDEGLVIAAWARSFGFQYPNRVAEYCSEVDGYWNEG